ncbi:Glycoprotein-N-acetylgalactosamine 3-beta-galactosyltransferase 1 [Bulinus truncatus]|nr:Glycoprotein-N-acetylgalactosamine 3-beta-galactosyltransferase 1 [Bulinus truncatus]
MLSVSYHVVVGQLSLFFLVSLSSLRYVIMAPKLKEFFIGILFGLSLTAFFVGKTTLELSLRQTEVHTLTDRAPWFQPYGAVRWTHRTDPYASRESQKFPPDDDYDSSTVARQLSKQVRILVWVMTTPKNLATKTLAIKQTWGKRCNVIIYFSSVNDQEFPTVSLDVPEGRDHLTGKTMAAFRYIYEHHFDEADWFMKADDDTYLIAENLRFFLSDKNKNDPVFFGHLFKLNVPQGYYSGGGGYVISKEALRRFGTRAVNSTLCREDGGDEDVEFALCMERLGVSTSRSLDEMGRTVFHPHPPSMHILGTYPPWHRRYTAGKPQMGFGVSKYAVSFHYVPPDEMKVLDFYMYHLRPYGVYTPMKFACNKSTNS